MRKFLFVAFLSILIVPYIVLFINITSWSALPWAELLPVLQKTIFQSMVSATISLILGFWGALGLLGLHAHRRNFYKLVFLLPNFLPLIFVILGFLIFLNPFPFGLTGIIIIHVFINIGLVAVFLAEALENKMGGVIELATIEGASKFQIIFKGILPMMKRDFLLSFMTVFSLCFSSFAIPSIVGGINASTLEILIYQKVKIMGEWSQALSLSAIQSFILIFMSFFLKKQKYDLSYRFRDFSALSSRVGLFLPILISLFIIIAPLIGFVLGLGKVLDESILGVELFSQVGGTILIGLSSGLFCLLMFLVFSMSMPPPAIRKFLISYVPPSTVLVGFSLLFIFPYEFILIKIAFGLTILTFPLLYRLRGFGVIDALEKQIEMGQLLGASYTQIYKKIILPQVFGPFCHLSGLCAFWAAGDFAVSSIISGKDISVGLLIQGLLNSYRIDQASVFVWIMLLCGVMCYLIFIGISYVASKKFKFKI